MKNNGLEYIVWMATGGFILFLIQLIILVAFMLDGEPEPCREWDQNCWDKIRMEKAHKENR